MVDIKLSELSQSNSVASTDLVQISQDQGVLNYSNGSRKVTFDDFGTSLFANVQSIQFDTNYVPPAEGTGLLHWDDDYKTLDLAMIGTNVKLQIGQEMHVYARASENILNGEVVIVDGQVGNSRPTVALADASNVSTSRIIGVATEDINSGSDGYVTTFGLVRDVDTTGLGEGNIVFLSNVAGQLLNVPPSEAGSYSVKVGEVVVEGAQGIILVDPGLDKSDLRLDKLKTYSNTTFEGDTIITSPIRSISNTYSIDLDSDYLILANANSGAFTVSLPVAANASGRQYTIKKIDSPNNAVTIDGNGSETIDGSTTVDITTQYESLTIMSDGSNWFIL